ncbi:MAG: hypothetical protein U5K33_05825 [Halofilum sp. (in: g-proteobacteria)]|nr:hypothetical protein [Halofilum sp. (in: g-proteobacteria)]
MHVRCVRPEEERPLHEHSGEDYGLADIPTLFQLGRIVADTGGRERVRLSAAEIRELKVLADAYSFDFEPGLIELCGELHRFAVDRREREFEFLQDE